MEKPITGRRALVTGASGGLGATTVRRLGVEGMDVVATGRRREAHRARTGARARLPRRRRMQALPAVSRPARTWRPPQQHGGPLQQRPNRPLWGTRVAGWSPLPVPSLPDAADECRLPRVFEVVIRDAHQTNPERDGRIPGVVHDAIEVVVSERLDVPTRLPVDGVVVPGEQIARLHPDGGHLIRAVSVPRVRGVER